MISPNVTLRGSAGASPGILSLLSASANSRAAAFRKTVSSGVGAVASIPSGTHDEPQPTPLEFIRMGSKLFPRPFKHFYACHTLFLLTYSLGLLPASKHDRMNAPVSHHIPYYPMVYSHKQSLLSQGECNTQDYENCRHQESISGCVGSRQHDKSHWLPRCAQHRSLPGTQPPAGPQDQAAAVRWPVGGRQGCRKAAK